MVKLNKFYNSRKERQSWITRRFELIFKDSNSVLDVGCWDALTKNYLPQHIKYTGIDIGGKPDIKLNLEKIKKLPFKNNSFDTIICTDVLEHLENIHDMFDELCRVSKKNIIISLPNPFISIWSYIFKNEYKIKSNKLNFGKYSKFYGLPLEKPIDRHKWFFNYDEAVNFIKYRAKKNGFIVKIIETELDYRNISIFKHIIRSLISKINKNFVIVNIIFLLEKK